MVRQTGLVFIQIVILLLGLGILKIALRQSPLDFFMLLSHRVSGLLHQLTAVVSNSIDLGVKGLPSGYFLCSGFPSEHLTASCG